MRRDAKKDRNHNEVQDYLEKQGWTVYDTSRMGAGFPDLMVSKCFGWKRLTAVVEIKDPEQPPSKRQLTKPQKDWLANWEGTYVLAETGPQAHEDLSLAALGLTSCSKCGSGY